METPNEIYFYGHTDEFGYMSNFYKTTFTDNSDPNNVLTFCCTEQYLMYHKCLTFIDNCESNQALLNLIMAETSPSKIKKFGRQVRNYNDDVWNAIRYNIMLDGLRLKFNQNNVIKLKLMQTEHKQLYEASSTDKIWGIGFTADNAIKKDKALFGRNLLGKALVEIRSELNLA